MRTARLSLLAAALAACADGTSPGLPVPDANLSAGASGDAAIVGGVFTQTNSATGNAVIAYARRADGSLSYLGSYATAGRGTVQPDGTGGGLGSQGAVVLTPNERFLYAVNAGSDEITGFAVAKSGLTLVTTIPSGGVRPNSVAATNHILYALNNTSHTVTGFRIRHDGSLIQVHEWTRPLNPNTSNGAQVQFTRDGRFLVVVERGTPTNPSDMGFDVFPVNGDGSLGVSIATGSMAAAPFGFDISKDGYLVVSEPGPANNSASSFKLGTDGSLHLVSGGVPALQGAPCWVVITKDGNFAYTANAGSASISGYAIGDHGALTLITPDGRTGVTGPTPLDMDISRDSRFLYVIEGGSGNVTGFAIAKNGSLARLADAARPAEGRGRGGLAAY